MSSSQSNARRLPPLNPEAPADLVATARCLDPLVLRSLQWRRDRLLHRTATLANRIDEEPHRRR